MRKKFSAFSDPEMLCTCQFDIFIPMNSNDNLFRKFKESSKFVKESLHGKLRELYVGRGQLCSTPNIKHGNFQWFWFNINVSGFLVLLFLRSFALLILLEESIACYFWRCFGLGRKCNSFNLTKIHFLIAIPFITFYISPS